MTTSLMPAPAPVRTRRSSPGPRSASSSASSSRSLAGMHLRWGTWPGVLGHTVCNAVLYHVLEPQTADTGRTNWFATVTGLVYGLTMLVGAAVFLRFFPLARTAERRRATSSCR